MDEKPKQDGRQHFFRFDFFHFSVRSRRISVLLFGRPEFRHWTRKLISFDRLCWFPLKPKKPIFYSQRTYSCVWAVDLSTWVEMREPIPPTPSPSLSPSLPTRHTHNPSIRNGDASAGGWAGKTQNPNHDARRREKTTNTQAQKRSPYWGPQTLFVL